MVEPTKYPGCPDAWAELCSPGNNAPFVAGPNYSPFGKTSYAPFPSLQQMRSVWRSTFFFFFFPFCLTARLEQSVLQTEIWSCLQQFLISANVILFVVRSLGSSLCLLCEVWYVEPAGYCFHFWLELAFCTQIKLPSKSIRVSLKCISLICF